MKPLTSESSIARLYFLVVGALLAGLGLVAYHNSLDVPFIHDDERSIRDNPRIRELWPFGDAGHAIQTSESGRPVVRLSLAVNYALGEVELGDHGVASSVARSLGIGQGGASVRGYHVFNLAVHVLSALVLFGVVWRTSRRKEAPARLREAAPILAPSAAAIWLVHPLSTDAVTYVIQRTELLMGLFYLSTLFTAILALDSRRPRVWSVISVLCCALGMGSKESMVSAPILVVLYDRTFAFPSFRAALRARWPLYAGLAGTWALLAALIASGPRSQTVGLDLGVAWWRYAGTQFGVILGYLRLSFWPDELCLDHGRTLASTAGEIVPGLLVVGALAAATSWALFRRPLLGFFGAWFFLILAPSSSVVPIITEVGAERRMYLPLAAVVVLVVLGIHVLASAASRWFGASSGVVRGVVALAIVLGATARTVCRNADFESDLSVWLDTVEKRPDNFVARNNLARAYSNRRRFDEALEQLSAAVALPACPVNVFANLGNAYINVGRLDDAESLFRHVLREHPAFGPARCGLGLALSRQGRWEEAIAEYERCLQSEGRSADAHCKLGKALLEVGRVPEAVEQFQRALEIDPAHASAKEHLGRAQRRKDE